MDIEKMERVGNFLKNASPDELIRLAEKMAKDKPELASMMVGIPDKPDRAKSLVKLELMQPKPNEEYVKGLIDGLWFGGLLTDTESDEFKAQLITK